jgi:hypothetical protein
MAGSADLQAGERDKMADFNTTSGTCCSVHDILFVCTNQHDIR